MERFRFFNEVLVWHAHGEEVAIFPALEEVAPSVAEAYEQDHRGLDAAFAALNRRCPSTTRLETARATAAFKFHLDLHLAKEDTHLYRLIRERVSMPDQGKAVGVMAGSVPRDRFPEVIAWMFPLLGDDDRENMTRIWQMVMPPEAFAGAVAARSVRRSATTSPSSSGAFPSSRPDPQATRSRRLDRASGCAASNGVIASRMASADGP